MLRTDGQVQEAIKKYFKDSTVLTIAHRLDNIVMSDRIMVMNQGAIEEIGLADDVFYRPKSTYTRTLLNAIPGNNLFAKKV